MTDDERAELEKRTKILVDEANQVYNRFFSNIDALHKKIITLFQIFLVLISIESVIIVFHLQNGYKFSEISKFLTFWIIWWGICSFLLLVYLVYPRWYKDVLIFEEDRFKELSNYSSQTLLSDFLYHMKESYDFNKPLYIQQTKLFYVAYMGVIIMTISYVILIISLRISQIFCT
ncbi:MAG: hypothetical protein WC379_16600 [Methanoregula sp.]|jgi:hypothetical protein